MVAALLLGLLAVGIGLSMLAQTQVWQKSILDSIEISKSKNLADSAKTRTKALFAHNPSLILSSLADWEEYLNNPSAEDSQEFIHPLRLCQETTDWEPKQNRILKYARGENIPLGNSGFFRLINLAQIENNKALVTVSARTNKGSVSNLQATLEYSLNYLPKETVLPGLWTDQEERIRSEVKGNLWANKCGFNVRRVRFSEEGYNANHVAFQFPRLPDLSEIIYRIPTSHTIRLDNNYSRETVFPRSEDSPTRVIGDYEVYEYVLKDFNSDAEIEIQTVVDGNPVIVVLNAENGIRKGRIKHTCGGLEDCPAENLIIINYSDNENDKMCFKTDKLEAFIFSPFAGVGFIKQSNNVNRPKVIGTVWTKELLYDISCGRSVIIQASLNIEQIIQDFQIINPYPQITGFSEFKPVDSKVIENELNIKNQESPFPKFNPGSIPIFIDEEFNPESP